MANRCNVPSAESLQIVLTQNIISSFNHIEQNPIPSQYSLVYTQSETSIKENRDENVKKNVAQQDHFTIQNCYLNDTHNSRKKTQIIYMKTTKADTEPSKIQRKDSRNFKHKGNRKSKENQNKEIAKLDLKELSKISFKKRKSSKCQVKQKDGIKRKFSLCQNLSLNTSEDNYKRYRPLSTNRHKIHSTANQNKELLHALQNRQQLGGKTCHVISEDRNHCFFDEIDEVLTMKLKQSVKIQKIDIKENILKEKLYKKKILQNRCYAVHELDRAIKRKRYNQFKFQ